MIGTRLKQTFSAASAFLLLSTSMMLVLGCDSDTSVSTGMVPVRGRILLDDVPLAGARVTFVPISPIDSSPTELEPMSYGTTDADGNYTLRQASGTVGATKGEHTVLISKPIDQDEATQSTDAVPEFYRQHGYLKRHVMPLSGGQQLDFELTTIDPLLKNLK